MTGEKGYVKFRSTRIQTGPVEDPAIASLNRWRKKLHELKLIGVYPNGIGYGNVSVRQGPIGFLITGSATGHLENLTGAHFTRVTKYSFEDNTVTCEGPVQASSESLTHAAVYESAAGVNAVIHVHCGVLWRRLHGSVPTSLPSVEYGTPGMALEIRRLFAETDLGVRRILVMGGHEEGIITFGSDLDDAGMLLLEYL